ncbi:phosphoenolpyruvate--protein phosphotransferase [Desulfopila sp. IMCC35006]|uniref:phosphoenolpyruvate--protein phosphotransferase n=1 Tax=Desulfopila sp. IMCC35006 TaxID=2569542 RepID=UPI0010AD4EC4|nr:phosphoenolpyruvate--protein phosphotransferase [Desulfopila sp. IMCC35006]TKB24699.1 phosphoenolpyruvate--protein phosphotransferase [Desulfopila sp. IMCC35006]
MMKLESNNVQLHVEAGDKIEAIRKVGEMLVESGNIKPAYIESMLNREKVANTFLGNGIAIPHGLPKDRESIIRTGIAVMQIPAGVEWNPGEIVFLIVGIAARSDEHIEILTNLTHILDNEKLIQKLSSTDDAEDIYSCLSGRREGSQPPAERGPTLQDFEKSVEVKIQGAHGLHARPATAFVELAKQFKASVHVRHKESVADGKSLVSLLKLGAGENASLRIMVSGEDEDEALKAIEAAVLAGLEDETEAADEVQLDAADHGWSPSEPTITIQGLSASSGLAIGPLWHFKKSKIVVASTAKYPAIEENLLHEAIATAQSELEQIHREVKAQSGAGKAAIFKAHIEFLNDEEMIAETHALIKKGHSAGWSWQKVIGERVEDMAQLDDPVLRGRATDINDVGSRVLRHLAEVVEDTPFTAETPVILVAEDLMPSDTVNLDPRKILGFCTTAGGPTSHTAIIARSLGIPAIVGAGPALLNQENGTEVILDGTTGNLYIHPHESDIKAAQNIQAMLADQRNSEHQTRFEPAIMTDGHRMEVVANIATASEAEQAVNGGAEGVGLMRTEFLFLDRSEAPTEEEQYQAYSQMTKALGGLPLIIRTLDVGGDKNLPYLQLPPEDASFMGIRGIRLCLAKPELFRPQLRAIYRAAEHGPIKIMFPMISTLEDLNAAKDMAEGVRRELGVAELPFGVMIEVPSAVMLARELAAEVDFFSIGTNDLTQYTLAMDRLHPLLARQADALHPAVLRMINLTVSAAEEAGIWVGVCGGIAADPQGAAILTGLGVKELSVSIPSVAAVKAQLRKLSQAGAKSMAQRALACRNAAEVRRLSIA